ncbi:MAG: hypothetical protein WBH44_07140 [Proteocatella sp.]
MQINLFEIIAQIINFLILLLILSKVLYKPVLKAMRERQEKINEDLNKADKRMEEANEIISLHRNKLIEIRANENEIMEMAKKSAIEEKEKLVESYRIQAEEKRKNYFNLVDDEKQQFELEVRKTLGENAVKIAENILKIMNKDDISDNIFDVFIGKVSSLESDLSEKYLQEEIPSPDKKIMLISAEELTADRKIILEEELKRQFGIKYSIDYTTDSNLILGYELRFTSFTLHTNIERYLNEAEDNLLKVLKSK